MRTSELTRETGETKIIVKINLDKYEKADISTPIAFLTHMLSIFSYHSGFALSVTAESLDGDPHHLIEDVAITIGKCFLSALGDKSGITRYGWASVPMDEALVLSSIDISGRNTCCFQVSFANEMINDFPTQMFKHFFESFSSNALITLHLNQLNGIDDHHIIESAFKSFAKSISIAASKSDKYLNRSASSKGVL